MEWKEKHVVFMVGLHWGGTGVLPRMLREHYQRNLLVVARLLATDRIHRVLEDPGNPAQQFGYSLYTFHQLILVDWDSVAVP